MLTWLSGGATSGKRAMALQIKEEFGFTFISTGDALREEMKKVRI